MTDTDCILKKKKNQPVSCREDGKAAPHWMWESWSVGLGNCLRQGLSNGNVGKKNFLKAVSIDGMCGVEYEVMKSSKDLKY